MSAPDYRFDEVEKDPAESRQVSLDWFNVCAKFRDGNRPYSANTFVRPTKANGFDYEATTAGTTAENEPRWPTTAGQTVVDGSVTWTARVASGSSINTPGIVSSTSDPVGLTVSGASVADLTRVNATYSGGVDGQQYDAVFTVTINGVARVGRQRVVIRRR